MPELQFQTYRGSEIKQVFEPLAKLRIAVFKEFPYLYDGHLDYEMDYLETYSRAPQAFLLAVFDQAGMVGAATCLPLEAETEAVIQPFAEAGKDISTIFYFGESILLPQYRGLGLGHRFFDEREAHARSFGRYDYTCFCGVVRPVHHPARPADYRPLNGFWRKRGYEPLAGLQCQFDWQDIGEPVSTKKPMQFWGKKLDAVVQAG